MLGVDNKSVLETNIALLRTIPEEHQTNINEYLVLNYCTQNPFAPLSREQICAELEESRRSAERGEGQDFDEALDEICEQWHITK